MKLLKSNWLVKVYKYNKNLTPDSFMPNKTDLCHFCRVVFFWVPFKVTVATVVVGFFSSGIVYFFFVMIPDTNWILHWFAWGVISGMFIFWYLADNYKPSKQMWKNVVNSLPGPPKWYDDLIEVIAAWWDAIEKKICPFIEIESDEDDG